MNRMGWKLLAAIVLLILGCAWIDGRSAKPNPQNVWTPNCVAYVPSAWGEYKGGTSQSGLAFQDRDGTLRFITNFPCNSTPAPALEIRRTATQ